MRPERTSICCVRPYRHSHLFEAGGLKSDAAPCPCPGHWPCPCPCVKPPLTIDKRWRLAVASSVDFIFKFRSASECGAQALFIWGNLRFSSNLKNISIFFFVSKSIFFLNYWRMSFLLNDNTILKCGSCQRGKEMANK